MPNPVKAGEVFEMARFFLNDTEGAVNTDEKLQPALKAAYEDLRMECEDNNIPYTNLTSQSITINAGVTNVGGSGGPALPLDLVEIIEVYERLAGSNNDFKMMRRRNFLPKTEVQTTYLEVYTWQKQELNFIGSTGAVEIKIDYVGNSLNQIVNANSQIAIYNSISFLWFRTAAFAAKYIMEDTDRSTELNMEAMRCIETMQNIGIKNQQSMPVRRRPFMSGYRQYGGRMGGAI